MPQRKAEWLEELIDDASDTIAQLVDIVGNLDAETYAPVLDQAREVMDRLNVAESREVEEDDQVQD